MYTNKAFLGQDVIFSLFVYMYAASAEV